MTKRRVLARLLPSLVVVMCAGVTGRSDAQTNYCTQTADTMLEACKASVADDGAVGRAVCLNITGTRSRNTCLDDLVDSQDEAISSARATTTAVLPPAGCSVKRATPQMSGPLGLTTPGVRRTRIPISR